VTITNLRVAALLACRPAELRRRTSALEKESTAAPGRSLSFAPRHSNWP